MEVQCPELKSMRESPGWCKFVDEMCLKESGYECEECEECEECDKVEEEKCQN